MCLGRACHTSRCRWCQLWTQKQCTDLFDTVLFIEKDVGLERFICTFLLMYKAAHKWLLPAQNIASFRYVLGQIFMTTRYRWKLTRINTAVQSSMPYTEIHCYVEENILVRIRGLGLTSWVRISLGNRVQFNRYLLECQFSRGRLLCLDIVLGLCYIMPANWS
jgi:hypothetical protein